MTTRPKTVSEVFREKRDAEIKKEIETKDPGTKITALVRALSVKYHVSESHIWKIINRIESKTV